MSINLRIALEADMDLINQIYRSIGFKESDFSNETILIAEEGDTLAGLGRLQKIDAESLEMGGIFVLESHRNKGIADIIVSKLVELSSPTPSVYCIPFAHLGHFYGKFGFHPVEEDMRVPQKVLSKHQWCNEFYEDKTLLLVRDNTPL